MPRSLRPRRQPKKGEKRVAYRFIKPESDQGKTMYQRLAELMEEDHFEDIAKARIGLAWCTSWKPDVDGRITLGKCRKASDLDRELYAYDYIILLNEAWWFDLATEDKQRKAILDHELMHCAPALHPRTGVQVVDERNRLCWRIRKHDIEEFHGVVERNGIYKRDVELHFAALRRGAYSGFQSCGNCDEGGWRTVENVTADRKIVERCTCWIAWQTRVNGVSRVAS